MMSQGCIVGTVGAGGRVVSAEAVGTAVAAVQGRVQERQKQFLVWAVPGLEVVREPEAVLEPEIVPEPGAVLEPEPFDLAGRVRWRGLA